MNCLLDTHAFLWSAFTPRKLSAKARDIVADPENDIVVSAVTFWEISLKHGLGKIELEGIAPDDLPRAAGRMGYELLSLDSEDAASFHRLPRVGHKDPFDRMLAHQAIRKRRALLSCDVEMTAYAPYGLEILW